MPRIKPRSAGWEAQTLPLCYAEPPLYWKDFAEIDEETRERQAREDFLREIAAKMGLPASMIQTSTRTSTTTTVTTTTTPVPQDIVVMGQVFNHSRWDLILKIKVGSTADRVGFLSCLAFGVYEDQWSRGRSDAYWARWLGFYTNSSKNIFFSDRVKSW